MLNPILNWAKRLWDHWNIRAAILCSLSLQVSLILFASCRKRAAHKISHRLVIFWIWAAYLLADIVANFAIGHLSTRQNSADSEHSHNDDLQAFWAPFLLVHLGGQDTITAFSLEDNELWIRHLLSFLTQGFATLYVFFLTLPHNEVIIPTILLFVAGVITYLERTVALYRSSMGKFRDSMLPKPDPGPNYAKLIEEHDLNIEAKLPSRIITVGETYKQRDVGAVDTEANKPADDLQIVQEAYRYFNILTGLIADQIFSFKDRNDNRKFFHSIDADHALRVLEVELNFIYETLFTKASVVQSLAGYCLRLLSFSLVLVALLLFHFQVEKDDFDAFDVKVTYVLLFGSIGLGVISFIRAISSDRTVADSKKLESWSEYSFWTTSKAIFTSWKVPLFNAKTAILKRMGLTKRWSRSISGCKFLSYCRIRRHQSRIVYFVVDFQFLQGLRDFFYVTFSVSNESFNDELWKFIFDELQEKSILFAEDPEDAKTIFTARGNFVLQYNDWGKDHKDALMPYVVNVTYDESLLLWHIATQLLYSTDNATDQNKEFSKLLSDYMLYLLIVQTNLMAAVAGNGKIRIRDTCAEAERFFKTRDLGPNLEQQACSSVLNFNTEIRPIDVKGDRSKSVLFDASRLAKLLKEMDQGKKWKLVSKVWVELMSYAAGHCRATAHTQQVSRGGELITLVWLLMAHFGIADQFQVSKGHARAKLIVNK